MNSIQKMLLERAEKDYPKGTVAISALVGSKFTSGGVILVNQYDNSVYCKGYDSGAYVIYNPINDEWAEIVESEPKSILEGKVAIQVNNEREFKLLMEHYESKGWKWKAGRDPLLKDISFTFPNAIKYHDLIQHSVTDENYRIIPFSDFAAEVGIKVPVKLLTSKDGVDVYEYDEVFVVSKPSIAWSFNCSQKAQRGFNIINRPNQFPCFSTREAAESWILEANKPKEIKFQLFDGKTAILTKEGVQVTEISSTTKSIWLTPSDIEDLSHNYSVLQQQSDKNASK